MHRENHSGSQSFNFTVMDANMPKTGTKTINIPAGIQSFKVYDDGGKDGIYYSGRNTSILVLTAPEGRVLQLSGSIMTRQYDNLTVYDNNAASGDMLIDNFGSPVYKAYNPIPTVCSTGQSMTIYFFGQNQYSNLDGFDLTVTVVPPSVTEGDANSDGQVTLADAVAIVNYILGKPSPGFNAAAADVNHDNAVTISDAVTVVNMLSE